MLLLLVKLGLKIVNFLVSWETSMPLVSLTTVFTRVSCKTDIFLSSASAIMVLNSLFTLITLNGSVKNILRPMDNWLYNAFNVNWKCPYNAPPIKLVVAFAVGVAMALPNVALPVKFVVVVAVIIFVARLIALPSMSVVALAMIVLLGPNVAIPVVAVVNALVTLAVAFLIPVALAENVNAELCPTVGANMPEPTVS